MKKVIFILVVTSLYFKGFADDPDASESTPPVLARQILSSSKSDSNVVLNWAADIPVLEKGTKDFPEDGQIFFALSYCYLKQQDMVNALKYIEPAYRLLPDNLGVAYGYSTLLNLNFQHAKAFQIVKDLAARNPNNGFCQMALAIQETAIQKYDDAITIFKSLQPTYFATLDIEDKSILLTLLGTSYLYTGNQSKAIDSAHEALSYVPSNVSALVVLGEAYLKLGNLEAAETALDQALALNPDCWWALYYKGIIFEKHGSGKKAQKSFQKTYDIVTNHYAKNRLSDNGEDYFLLYLTSKKLSKDKEADAYKKKAAQLLFTYEAPEKQN